MCEEVACLLCLENIDASDNHIDIDSTEIQSQPIAQILEKYFPKLSDWVTITSTRSICASCWETVKSFYKYCLRVQHAHLVLMKTKSKTRRRKLQSAAKELESNAAQNDVNFTLQQIPTSDEDVTNKLAFEGSTDNDNTYEYSIKIEPVFFDPESAELENVKDESEPLLPKLQSKRQREKVLMKPNRKIATKIVKIEELLLPGLECKDSYIDECHIDAEEGTALKQEEYSDENWTAYAMKLISHNGNLNDIEAELSNLTDDEERFALTAQVDEFINEHFELSCSLCGTVATNFTKLQTHFRKQHKTDAYVMCCNKTLLDRTALIDHIHLHLNPDGFKCPKCDKSLEGSRYFRHHLKTHEELKKQTFLCKVCTKMFYTNFSLKRHEETHIKKKEHPCPQCDSFFSTKKTLRRHLRNIHSNAQSKSSEEQPPVKCEVCGIFLRNALGLKRHMQGMHTAENLIPQTCPICLKVLTSLRAYKHHMHYMHELEPKHACTMCDKVFKRPSHLKEHMCSHTGEALYTCGFCPKMYTSDATLCIHRQKKHPKEWEESRRKREMGRGKRIPIKNDDKNSEH